MSSEIYEAAAIDGANKRQTLIRITLPILKPALAIVFLLRILDSIRTFDSIYILTGGGPGTSTQTVGIYIYKTAFIYGDLTGDDFRQSHLKFWNSVGIEILPNTKIVTVYFDLEK